MKKKFFLLFLFHNLVVFSQQKEHYPEEMIFNIIDTTIKQLEQLTHPKSVSQKYNVSYPPSKVLNPREKVLELINQEVTSKINQKYKKFNFAKAEKKAKELFPIYSLGSFVRVNYRTTLGTSLSIEGIVTKISKTHITINRRKINLLDMEPFARDAFIKGVNKDKRKSYIYKQQILYNDIKNKYRKQITPTIKKKYYTKNFYIFYKKYWWKPQKLLIRLTEKENTLLWPKVYDKVARKVSRLYGYEYKNKSFDYKGLNDKTKKIYFDYGF